MYRTLFFHLEISPYIIFADVNPRTPDMQAETGQPIYFWNRLLKAVVLQKTESSKSPYVPRTKPKTLLEERVPN